MEVKKTILAIDGDIVAYRCAAASETRSIKATHKVTGQVIEAAHRTAFKAQISGAFEPDEFEVEDIQTAEDIKNAFHGIKTTIEALCKSCDADEYEVYVSGKGNFRLDLPLPTQYKSNRDDTIRPVHLKACKQYLVDHHEAVPVDGEEADDMLSRRSYQGTLPEYVKKSTRIIQASIDKDANSNVGWLYNWLKMTEPMEIKGLGHLKLDDKKKLSGYSRKWFYAQWVLGDATDGFKPSEISGKKFGDVGAYNLLNDCKTDKECVEAVYKQYLTWYPKPVTYKAWDGKEYTKDAIELMDMYAACAHMRRWKGDVFDTRKLFEALGIEEVK